MNSRCEKICYRRAGCLEAPDCLRLSLTNPKRQRGRTLQMTLNSERIEAIVLADASG